MTAALQPEASPTSTSTDTDLASKWIRRLQVAEAKCQSIGDALNPILVKETRQALKSRQFLVTFSLLLIASFGWSVAGSLMLMPSIYYSPSAPTLLVGYYLLLAVPMLFVVPLAAYRSLAAEIDDGTLELLRVTTLSPMQIVVGKLCSAMLQMMLYFVALIPCVAYAYSLRGTDLPSLIVLLGIVLLAAVQLTILGLFLAPMPTGRAGQLTVLIGLVAILVAAEYAVAQQALPLILQANILSEWARAFISFSGVAIVASTSYLLLTAAAARLAPACSNRSTKLRIALLMQQYTVLGLIGYAVIENFGSTTLRGSMSSQARSLLELLPWLGVFYLAYWIVIGSMMAAESPVLTPRVRRELPQSFVARMLGIFFTPGPATGIVFSLLAALSATLFVWATVGYLNLNSSRAIQIAGRISCATFGYGVLLLILVRWSASLLRRVTDFQPAVGMALLAIVALLTSVVPYSLYMIWNDYPAQPAYSWWQLVNWFWTLRAIWDGQQTVHWIVLVVGVLAFLTHVAFLGKAVLPQRIPTPRRVTEEQRRIRGIEDESAEKINPLAVDT